MPTIVVDEGIYNSLIQEQKQWQHTSMALDQSKLKIYGLEQDVANLNKEKDKLQKAHIVAWEAGGAVLQQTSLQAEGLRNDMVSLVAQKTQLTTQLQAKNQEICYLDTELKHMTKQAVDTENAFRQTAAEVEQLKKEKQQLQQLLLDTQQAAAITNHQTLQEAALIKHTGDSALCSLEARLCEALQSKLLAEHRHAQVNEDKERIASSGNVNYKHYKSVELLLRQARFCKALYL